jgi:AcrR family transcriptional regulator
MTARADAAAATGERLLAAAWEHFGSRPYEEVRLQDIASDAGVTVQTLYLRMGNKDALLTEAYKWWGKRESAARDAAQVGAVRYLMDAGRDYHRRWAEGTFEPLLHGLRGRRRERRLIGIIAASDVLVWKLLRVDMGVERAEAEQIVADMIRASNTGTLTPVQ